MNKKDNLYSRVHELLKQYPQTRNSDKNLYLTYWVKYQRELVEKVGDDWRIKDPSLFSVLKLQDPNEISRMRRKIQEKGEYLPTLESVRKARRISEDEWKTYMLDQGVN